jgi:hypothetical protein
MVLEKCPHLFFKPEMVASAISKSITYHEKKDAYFFDQSLVSPKRVCYIHCLNLY